LQISWITWLEGAVTARRAGLCQLRGLLVSAPEPLRAELRSLTRAQLLRRLAAVRPERRQDPELRGTLLALRALARRVKTLTVEERELAGEIETLTRKLAPLLLDQPGVGPLAAAQILISWSHRGRIRNEAAFARLAGCAPIPASSGQTIRSSSLDAEHIRQRSPTSTVASAKARAAPKRRAASSATSPATSTDYSNMERRWPLDRHRSITGPGEGALAHPTGSRRQGGSSRAVFSPRATGSIRRSPRPCGRQMQPKPPLSPARRP
jgi:Transposase IS116/IS110/IS902 family